MGELGATFILVISIVAIVLVILWMILPFTVGSLLTEVKKINNKLTMLDESVETLIHETKKGNEDGR